MKVTSVVQLGPGGHAWKLTVPSADKAWHVSNDTVALVFALEELTLAIREQTEEYRSWVKHMKEVERSASAAEASPSKAGAGEVTSTAPPALEGGMKQTVTSARKKK